MQTLSLTDRQWARYHRGIAGEVTRRFALRREALILDHLLMVERIARHLRQTLRRSIPQQLELSDLMQDGTVGLVQAADRYRSEDGAFDKFAYHRVRGAILDAHKRRAWREEQHCQLHDWLDEKSNYFLDPAPGLDDVVATSERSRRLREAVASLPDDERLVLELNLRGQVVASIAAVRGKGTFWARVRLRAAREKVAAHLTGRSIAVRRTFVD